MTLCDSKLMSNKHFEHNLHVWEFSHSVESARKGVVWDGVNVKINTFFKLNGLKLSNSRWRWKVFKLFSFNDKTFWIETFLIRWPDLTGSCSRCSNKTLQFSIYIFHFEIFCTLKVKNHSSCIGNLSLTSWLSDSYPIKSSHK